MTVDAVVFDFDGVLADSERLHEALISQGIADLGLPPVSHGEYMDRLIGFDDRDAFRHALLARGRTPSDALVARLVAEKARAFAARAEAGGVPPLPGAAEAVLDCAARVPCALCSGALATDVRPVLRAMGLDGAFAALVTAEATPASKPDPAPYRLCLERLGVPPARAVAFEDTPDGVRSARAAGLRVVALRTSLPPAPLLEAGAAATLPDLRAFRWALFGDLP